MILKIKEIHEIENSNPRQWNAELGELDDESEFAIAVTIIPHLINSGVAYVTGGTMRKGRQFILNCEAPKTVDKWVKGDIIISEEA